MSFSEQFSQYLSQYQLTIAELSNETGISKTMLSRMKLGKKEPLADSELLDRLATGLAALAKRSGDADTDFRTIKESLQEPLLARESFDLQFIVTNLNHLIDALDFRVSDLSRHLRFDASYLSLIRSGKRTPSDIAGFCNGIADFISLHYEQQLPLLGSVLGCPETDISSRNSRKAVIYQWLTKHAPKEDTSTLHFLQKLDTFDLGEYINALQLAQGDVPVPAASLPMQKNYYRATGFMQAELNWLQAVIASPGASSVLFYSDMPIEGLSQNAEFSKQWMMGVALLLKKGVHLNMIHQIDRPEPEMMLGLEAWIPLYMTGQVSPYYLKNNQTPYFHHFLRVSDAAVLSGEAINGYFENGCFYFTRNKEELTYYAQRGANLLTKAQPLMEIYRKPESEQYHAFVDSRIRKAEGAYRNLLSVPPIYTISPELLSDILRKNNASAEDTERITAYAQLYRQWVEEILMESTLTDELPEISEREFCKYPVTLPLSDLFPDKEYTYTYEDYLTHLQQTKAFAEEHPQYHLSLNRTAGFRNIQIRMVEGKSVVISKEKAPTIHFAVHHPKLRNAIEHLALPIVENTD